MLDAILMTLGFDWKGFFALLLGAGAFVGWTYFRGRSSAQEDAARDTLKSLEEGRRAVARGEASNDTPDERVRKNDGAWK